MRIFPDMDYMLAWLEPKKSFWRARSFFRNLLFLVQRLGFLLRKSSASVNKKTHTWHAMLKDTVWPTLWALLVGMVSYLFERNMSLFVSQSWIRDNIIGYYFSHPLDEGNYTQLIAVIAGVAGVFLGLYFSTVGTVLSNAYSTVPASVRNLLLRDEFGNNYVRFISFLTAFSVVLLAFEACGAPPLHLALPVLLLMSCPAIFIFVHLGVRVLQLTDPTLFFHTPAAELVKASNNATCHGYQWADHSFQDFYHRQGFAAATTVVDLIRLADGKKELRDNSYPELISNSLALVIVYLDHKHEIPSTSAWYGTKYQYSQWYLSDSSQLEMATRTDTTLLPTNVPDTDWLENLIMDGVLNAWDNDATKTDDETLLGEVTNIPGLFEKLGYDWQVENGRKWYARISGSILNEVIRKDQSDTAEGKYSIALVDVIATLPMKIELGFFHAVNEIDIGRLRDDMMRMDWSRPDSPYQFRFPPKTITTLEELQKGIAFEKKTGSATLTPNWYVVESAFHSFELELKEQWQTITSLLEFWYPRLGKALSDAQKYKSSLTVYSRALEVSWKIDNHSLVLQTLCEALRKDQKIDFMKQAEWDWDSEKQKLDSFRVMAVDGQADLIPQLWDTHKPDPDLPDFFGGAVHRTGEECYKALTNQDDHEFERMFRPYFYGILGIDESVRIQARDGAPYYAATRISDPILELFDISGYARIYSEYHQDPGLWETCKSVWDTYLENSPQTLETLAFISQVHQSQGLPMPARDSLRSNRQYQLLQLLKKLPTKPNIGYITHPRVVHPSKLIRNIAPITFDIPILNIDAIDVFTIEYLMNFDTKKTLDFGVQNDKIETLNKDFKEEK